MVLGWGPGPPAGGIPGSLVLSPGWIQAGSWTPGSHSPWHHPATYTCLSHASPSSPWLGDGFRSMGSSSPAARAFLEGIAQFCSHSDCPDLLVMPWPWGLPPCPGHPDHPLGFGCPYPGSSEPFPKWEQRLLPSASRSSPVPPVQPACPRTNSPHPPAPPSLPGWAQPKPLGTLAQLGLCVSPHASHVPPWPVTPAPTPPQGGGLAATRHGTLPSSVPTTGASGEQRETRLPL